MVLIAEENRFLIPDARVTEMTTLEQIQYCRDVVATIPYSTPLGYGSNDGKKGGFWVFPRADSRHALWMPAGTFYDHSQVQMFLDFCYDYLTFPGGPKAGHPVTFTRFQIDHIIAPILGLYERESGLPLIRTLFFLLARGNAKSFVLACLAIWMMVGRGFVRSTVDLYSTSMEQAKMLWQTMSRWIWDAPDTLGRLLEPKSGQKAIDMPHSSGSRLESRTGQPDREQGRTPSFAVIDDVIAQPHGELISVVQTGCAKNTPSLMCFATTPKPVNVTDAAYSLYEQMCAVARDRSLDDQKLPVIFEPEEGEAADPYDLRNIVAANPALRDGGFVEMDRIVEEAQTARLDVTQFTGFKAYRACIWGRDSGYDNFLTGTKWSDMKLEQWLDPAELNKMPMFIGIDPSTRADLTAVCFLWYDDLEHQFFADWIYWCHRDTMDLLEDWTNQKVILWRTTGGSDVTLVGDDSTPFISAREVCERVADFCEIVGEPEWSDTGKPFIGIDRDIGQVYNKEMSKVGLEVQLLRCTSMSISPATVKAMEVMREGKLSHRGCHLTGWQITNSKVNMKINASTQCEEWMLVPPRIRKVREKQDGASALVLAFDRWLAWSKELAEGEVTVSEFS